MESVPASVEEKIMYAAIECLERYGVQGTTNRRIAEIAGINSAAINYYFRSKEVLIQRVMEKTLDNAFDWNDFAKLSGDTPNKRCLAIFEDLLTGGINFPGITRAHFFDLLTTGDYESLVVKRINQFAAQLSDDLITLGLKRDRNDLQIACAQITSSVFFMALAPQIFKTGFGLDMTDKNTRSLFLNRLVEKLL